MTYDQMFKRRTLSIYRNMQARFQEKRDRRGRIIRIGQQIPFTLAEFRAKVSGFFINGPGMCRYCNAWLTIGDIACDHEIPVTRGGSLELSNIGLICVDCNNRKGRLLPSEWAALYNALGEWPEAARRDVLSRLGSAVQLAAKDRYNRAKALRQAKQLQEAGDANV